MRTGCSSTDKGRELDDALFRWFKQTRAMGVTVSGPLLLTQAQQLATELGIDNFTPHRNLPF